MGLFVQCLYALSLHLDSVGFGTAIPTSLNIFGKCFIYFNNINVPGDVSSCCLLSSTVNLSSLPTRETPIHFHSSLSHIPFFTLPHSPLPTHFTSFVPEVCRNTDQNKHNHQHETNSETIRDGVNTSVLCAQDGEDDRC